MGSAMLGMTGADLEKLRRQSAEFNDRWKARGGKLTLYRCTHCRELVTIRQPTADDVGEKGCWDSATVCTACGRMNFVAVYPDGKATAKGM